MAHSSRPLSTARSALKVAFIYLVVASVWIAFSDALLARMMDGEPSVMANTVKGIGFVVITAGLLFALIRRELERRQTISDRFRLYLDHSPDLVYRYRLEPDPAFEYVSPAATVLTGYTPEEHYADPHLGMKLVHPDDRHLLEAAGTGPTSGARTMELRWVRKDGSVLWVEQNNRIRVDEGGSRILEGSARDITQRRMAEEERRRLQHAVEEVADSIVITDPEGTILFANRAAAELTGYRTEQLVGLNARVLRSGEHPDSLYRKLWSTLSRGRSWRGRLRNRRRNGDVYTQETTISPVVDGSGQITSHVAVARDVTVEEALQERLEYAQRLELVGQMAAGTAHDFKNLLGVMRLNAEEAHIHLTDQLATARQNLQEVLETVHRGERLVTRLLSMGAGEDLTVEALDPREFLDSLLPSLRTVLPAAVEISCDVAPGTPPLLADRGALEQIALNLVANAGHAIPDGGTIAIHVGTGRNGATPDRDPDSGELPSRVHLLVTDTGVGMDEDVLSRIWEPFFTTRRGKGGTGLGLPMVRLLTERLGGGIRIESEPGRGTTADVILPAAPAFEDRQPAPKDPVPPSGAPAAATAEDRPSARILVVDDDQALRRVLSRTLQRMGHKVTAVDCAPEALRLLEEGEEVPDLVISDVLMPGMNGVELFFRIQEMGIRTSFVFMSGAGASDTPAQALLSGSVFFLEKPFALKKLEETVELALAADAAEARVGGAGMSVGG